jgi:CRP/FNR family transcriptional regulator, nitrogen oxide reductase regulator
LNTSKDREKISLSLANASLFSGLDTAQLRAVSTEAREKKAQAGSFFFFEGDQAEYTHVLIEGQVKLTQVTLDGQQVIQRYISPVEEFAVIAALSETSYPVSAEAVEDSLALIWDKRSMQALMERFPQIALNAVATLGARVREFQDRLREMATERVERRVARALLRLVRQAGRKVPEGVLIDFPISRQDLAQMTGATLFTVSRILSSWESRGLIQSGREKIIIRIPHSLVVIAEDLPPGQAPDEAD